MTEAPFISLALGAYLELRAPLLPTADVPVNDGQQVYRFQNFFIGTNSPYRGDTYSFVPFGFSGMTVSRQGDNVDANLVFPNNGLSRAFTNAAVEEEWSAVVRVCWIQNINDPQQVPTLLHRYVGQVSSAQWDDTTVTLVLNSILDAVKSQIPARTLQQLLVGNVPFSGQVSLR